MTASTDNATRLVKRRLSPALERVTAGQWNGQ